MRLEVRLRELAIMECSKAIKLGSNKDVQLSKSLLRPGGTQTGTSIASFNLDRVLSSPGLTNVFQKHSWVPSSRRFPGVDPSDWAREYESKRPDFVERMVPEIIRWKRKVVRIHGTGDFYSNKYIAKWIDIINKTPDVAYYARTHSWRCPYLRQRLGELRRLPNMQLWWFSDREAARPPEGLVAYLSTDDEDAPKYGASLIFRVKHDTEKLEIGGIRVCPLQSGRPEIETGGMTCEKCRICFSLAKAGS